MEISQNSDGYEITFDCPKNQSNNSENIIEEIKDTKIPDWVKNTMKWYVEEKISKQEIINESIIKIN